MNTTELVKCPLCAGEGFMPSKEARAHLWFERNLLWGRGDYPGQCDLQDERLIRLFKETWDRLPEHDQALLREMISTVREGGAVDRTSEGTWGTTSSFDGESLARGMGYIADQCYEIVLYADRYEGYSDAAVIGIIAHELAHAALRHMSMAASSQIVREHRPKEWEMIKTVQEWEADHRAWVWGFWDEIQEVWKALEFNDPVTDYPWLWEYELDETGQPREWSEEEIQ